jgi:hypothetical protein
MYYGINSIRDVTSEEKASSKPKISAIRLKRTVTSTCGLPDSSHQCQEDESDYDRLEELLDGYQLQEERSDWFDTVGEENPFEDNASKESQSPPLN